MSDILIRGMEMPKNCEDCRLSYSDEYGMTICAACDDCAYSVSCPLVPLPEGHGDLIEKAEAYDRIMEQEGGNYIDMDSVGMGLEECQIFVPAEGGIKNGN